MILMCVVGLLSVFKLNRQFFPTFDIENISVSVEWPGATAEEIDRSIISILEKDPFLWVVPRGLPKARTPPPFASAFGLVRRSSASPLRL